MLHPTNISRLTFANVVSVIALFVALGGGAYAVSVTQKNSVISKSAQTTPPRRTAPPMRTTPPAPKAQITPPQRTARRPPAMARG